MSDKTTRRQITHEERDVVCDWLYEQAREALGLMSDVGITPDQWEAASVHIERAAKLRQKPKRAKLRTTKAETRKTPPHDIDAIS